MISIARIFGAPVSVPAGKVARSTSRLVMPSFSSAFDVADDVHHVRVALDHEGFGHLHAAGLRDAADVVARQVDQHQVLGALLRVGRAARPRAPCRARASRRAGACRRAGGSSPCRLRSCAPGAPGSRATRRRSGSRPCRRSTCTATDSASAARGTAKRRLGVALAQALADLHLHHVAGRDVVLATSPPRRGSRPSRTRRSTAVRCAALHRRRRHAVLQLVGQLARAAACAREYASGCAGSA